MTTRRFEGNRRQFDLFLARLEAKGVKVVDSWCVILGCDYRYVVEG